MGVHGVAVTVSGKGVAFDPDIGDVVQPNACGFTERCCGKRPPTDRAATNGDSADRSAYPRGDRNDARG
jgi:hypothetical protein